MDELTRYSFEIQQKIPYGQQIFLFFPQSGAVLGLYWSEGDIWKLKIALRPGLYQYYYIVSAWEAPKVFFLPFLSPSFFLSSLLLSSSSFFIHLL